MTIISRKAAKAAGQKYYFTGKPCKRGGHVEKRFVSSFLCMACARDKARERYNDLDYAQRQEVRTKRSSYFQQWRAVHREELLASSVVRNKVRKEQQPDYFKQYYAANKERRKQESQAWYRDNAEYADRRQRAYNAAHPEQVRANGRKSANKRRATQKSVFVEVVDPKVVFKRDQGVCGICLTSVDPAGPWEIDHIIPLSKGGEHSYANVQLSHRKCNRAKCARILEKASDGRRHDPARVDALDSVAHL
jgi:5-methylcytosine-specific restriction endonuclease McrA